MTSPKYIDARYDADTQRLQIYATDALADYEYQQTSDRLYLSIELLCTTGTRTLRSFEQPFDESNNHAPAFVLAEGEEAYAFRVTLPLPRGFDLTFFQQVGARDLDIRNNRVSFTSANAVGLTVGSAESAGSDGKTFYATLVTTHQMLSIEGGQLEFDITGTVSGE